ncbi:hypothetical protein LXA43DRAFT_1104832 [Ganoderma leucocontextum]|nr:hypothetical protein LXA43DRAFT_1104832 [Ganoderma leucocontextum]
MVHEELEKEEQVKEAAKERKRKREEMVAEKGRSDVFAQSGEVALLHVLVLNLIAFLAYFADTYRIHQDRLRSPYAPLASNSPRALKPSLAQSFPVSASPSSMDSFNIRSLDTLPEGAVPTFSDGIVGALSEDRSVFITSPNAEYIPQIEHGLLTVHLRDDGRFGLADPVHAPQIFSWNHSYLCAMLRPAPDHDSLAVMWKSPTSDHFIPNKGSVVGGFGRLSNTFLDAFDLPVSGMIHRATSASDNVHDEQSVQQAAHLRWYVVAMRQALDRLRYMPASFRDQVIQVVQLQRYWLLANAWLEYHSRAHTVRAGSSAMLEFSDRWMGAWTTDPLVVQHLMAIGIPVWFLRASEAVHGDILVRHLKVFPEARHVTSMPFFGEEPLYRGLPGDKHLEATMRACHTYRDLSRIPAASLFQSEDYTSGLSRSQTPKFQSQRHQGSSGAGVDRGAPSHKFTAPALGPYPKTKPGKPHPSQIRGRDKFAEFAHRWMPRAIPAWERAMQSVDRTEKARATNEIWGYWIPEPAILVSPTDQAKVERHVLNWLRARPNWLYLLRVPGSGATRVGTQAWRQFLNGVPEELNEHTRVGRRNFEIRQIFGDIFAEADFAGRDKGPIDWQGYSVSELSDDIGPKVLWEVFELGFRYELLAVERFLRPQHTPRDGALQDDLVGELFPEGVVHTVPFLPSSHTSGLFAGIPHRKIKVLNAFKAVLHKWPGCPTVITQQEPLRLSDTPSCIEAVEFNLASFYVHTFFRLSGRAPIVPHLFPM